MSEISLTEHQTRHAADALYAVSSALEFGKPLEKIGGEALAIFSRAWVAIEKHFAGKTEPVEFWLKIGHLQRLMLNVDPVRMRYADAP